MRKTKTTNVEHTFIESITCDICKKEFPGSAWARDAYSALETNVYMQTGGNYPDGGFGYLISFDICPKCFEDELVPALAGLGASPTITEWDW